MHGAKPDARRASTLLVVLSVLVVVSSLATLFARLLQLEREASSTRVDEVRARFLASAGIERALAEIEATGTRPWDGPDAAWFYRGRPDLDSGHGVPLEWASAPSFAEPDLAYERAYSGSLPPTYEPLGDTYALRVLDSASMIDLNAPEDPRLPDSEQPLVRMLASLARALDPSLPPLTPAEAEMVFAYRQALPSRRFQDRGDLLLVPGNPVTRGEFERLADFVTTHAWADPAVVAPMDPDLVPGPGEEVHGRTPTGAPRLLARRPVNVNTAPREVLIAVLAGISAFYVEESVERAPAGGSSWHALGTSARTAPVRFDQAARLAEAIAVRRSTRPFRGWLDVEAFLAEEVASGTIDRWQSAAIRAAVDPNTDTHRANPDLVAYRPIDKFDLVATTTELTFHSNGIFEIDSIGRVTSDGGFLRAQARVSTVIEAFRVIRHSSQAHFVQGTFGTYVLAEPVLFQPNAAVLAREDLELQGNVSTAGETSSVHTNSDLVMTGNPYVSGDATATGAYLPSNETVEGVWGGGYSPLPIPTIYTSRYRSIAGIVYSADGTVFDSSGSPLAVGRYAGFLWRNGTWTWKGPETPSGVLYFEGHVDITSKTDVPWQVTMISTGHISVQGAIQLKPAPDFGILFIAGTDLKVLGTPGSTVEGVAFVGEQMDLGGNTYFLGSFIVRGAGRVDPFVTANRIHGDVVIEHRQLPPLPLDWILTELPAMVSGPEADATAIRDGAPSHLPTFADYDGSIRLATVTTNRVVLGVEPYDDRLLARWKDGSLDAELGGGALGVVADAAGPLVGPVAGSAVPGSLLPDGIFGEFDAVAGYEAAGNVGPVQGTIAFWVKPAWGESNRTHHLLSLSRTDDVGTQSFQFARTGSWFDPWSERTGFHYERSTIENSQAERFVHSTWSPPPHGWTHVVLVYDLADPEGERSIRVYVDGVEMPGAVRETGSSYALGPDEEARLALSTANLLRLGERRGADYGLPGTSPEATYDELVVLPWTVESTWPAALYAEGRYYSKGPAEYESPALSLIPTGARLLHASWTVRLPEGWTGPPPTLVLEEAGVPFASTTDPDGLSLGRQIAGDVRYRVILLDQASPTPFFTTPVVDDVTVAFAAAPRFLAWEETR